jgi:hypothetical protein
MPPSDPDESPAGRVSVRLDPSTIEAQPYPVGPANPREHAPFPAFVDRVIEDLASTSLDGVCSEFQFDEPEIHELVLIYQDHLHEYASRHLATEPPVPLNHLPSCDPAADGRDAILVQTDDYIAYERSDQPTYHLGDSFPFCVGELFFRVMRGLRQAVFDRHDIDYQFDHGQTVVVALAGESLGFNYVEFID